MRIQRSDEYVGPTLLSANVRLSDDKPSENSAFGENERFDPATSIDCKALGPPDCVKPEAN